MAEVGRGGEEGREGENKEGESGQVYQHRSSCRNSSHFDLDL